MKKIVIILFLLIVNLQLLAQTQLKSVSVNLTLRTTPQLVENAICIIPKGSIIKIDYSKQNVNDWLEVQYDGRTGFVLSRYVTDFKTTDNLNYETGNGSGATVKHYTNSKGEKIQSPTYYTSPPAGATAECRDGTFSFSQSRRGTCSHHGGVKRWLK